MPQKQFSPGTGIDATAEQMDALHLVQRLTAISTALSLEKNLDLLLEMILCEAQSLTNADGGTLYFLNEKEQLEFAIVRTKSLNIAYGGTTGERAPMEPLEIYFPGTQSPNLAVQAVFAVVRKKPINIADVYDASGFDFEGTRRFDELHDYRTVSVVTIPLLNQRGESLGCLQLVNAQDPKTGEVIAFSQHNQKIVEALAAQAAVILDNKRLIDAQEHLLDSFIKVLAKAIDAKSPYTGAHCERVPVLTEMLAEAGCKADHGIFSDFNLTEEGMHELHVAAWLHDCGKISTPVHIMDKSTKLEAMFDRIELLRTRWEILRRDAEIIRLKELQKPGAEQAAIERRYQNTLKQLDEEMAFLERTNLGGEFMDDAHLEHLKHLAARHYMLAGKDEPLLSENEVYNLSIRRGTINAEERQIMNDHMVHTANMLEALPFPKHLRNVPEYALGHHERMDGRGYPKGVKAGEMSIPARMMAVADVFEALTAADRPYKPAKKLSESMKIIADMKRNHHLDPDIVDLFVTSKVYLEYAKQFLDAPLIDAVDEQAILDVKPVEL